MIWEYIKADSFFRDYLPHIKSHKHKIRGKNGRGNPTEFSTEEKRAIRAAIKKMLKNATLP
ncbi:hypothetical protein [Niabella aurantiaca]|uniref:hypothetical protein n=1 Tax=Niabella aurantiaca TaxID=379900 RepID=UPI000369E92A|nr:hypothetical protein [Niabella aurantiaca]